MNYLDLIFIIVLAYFIFKGLRHGFIKSIGGIIGLIIAVYFAGIFYPNMSSWLQEITGFFNEFWANIIAFLLVFVIINRVFALLVFFIDKIFRLPLISPINKILGGVFGFLQGLLLITVALTVLTNFSILKVEGSTIEDSKMAPYISKVLDFMNPFLPSSLDEIPGLLESSKEKMDDLMENTGIDLENMDLDELINYLNEEKGISEEVINKIKNQGLVDGEINKEVLLEKFREYLDTLENLNPKS
ncbi:CvpA family protein [bacterium]|nr:CvpA family protein [bacterium]